ncbi:hypothetical protein K440DRAFT_663440 [Wilcoxina mikolae CBS 423.85]|nr:hypothetical protein K440DRAFT_663440 [Wilcoxina mikolae CBS 423.85]
MSSISAFTSEFAVWCEKTRISRAEYSSLREVLNLATPKELQELPYTLSTLLQKLRRSLPTPTIYAKEVPVTADKQGLKGNNALQTKVHEIKDVFWSGSVTGLSIGAVAQ